MAAEAVIGKNYTFQVLFLDDSNQPIVPNNPMINIFRYNHDGGKQALVIAQPMLPVSPPEIGRYIYKYNVPLSLVDGDNLYGEMEGNDPDTGLRMFIDQTVIAIAPARGAGVAGINGLSARFIK